MSVCVCAKCQNRVNTLEKKKWEMSICGRESIKIDRERIDANMEYMYLSNGTAIRNTPTFKMTTERGNECVWVWVCRSYLNCLIGYRSVCVCGVYECEIEWTICATCRRQRRRRTSMSHCALKPFVIIPSIYWCTHTSIHGRAKKETNTMSIRWVLTHSHSYIRYFVDQFVVPHAFSTATNISNFTKSVKQSQNRHKTPIFIIILFSRKMCQWYFTTHELHLNSIRHIDGLNFECMYVLHLSVC